MTHDGILAFERAEIWDLTLPRKLSPAQDAAAKTFESISGQRFGEDISKLMFGGHALDGHSFVKDVLTEVVELHSEVLSAWT